LPDFVESSITWIGQMTTLEPSIETWLRTFMNNIEHPTRDDVHIDQLDAALGDRATWETAGVKCLVTAARLVKEQARPRQEGQECSSTVAKAATAWMMRLRTCASWDPQKSSQAAE